MCDMVEARGIEPLSERPLMKTSPCSVCLLFSAEGCGSATRSTLNPASANASQYALIVSELAGSLVLVASAGLLIRSLSEQMSAKLGFDAVQTSEDYLHFRYVASVSLTSVITMAIAGTPLLVVKELHF